MAFESIRKFRSVVKKVSPDVLLSMAIGNDTPYKDGTIPRVLRLAVAGELVAKYNLGEKRVDFLIDEETNQGMVKLDKDGMKVAVPTGVDGNGKRGYIRLRLPKYLNDFDNFSGYELTIVDFLDDRFIFELPLRNDCKNSDLF